MTDDERYARQKFRDDHREWEKDQAMSANIVLSGLGLTWFVTIIALLSWLDTGEMPPLGIALWTVGSLPFVLTTAFGIWYGAAKEPTEKSADRSGVQHEGSAR